MEIEEQLERYFQPSELQRDRHMRRLLEDNDGWIPIESLAKFNKLRHLLKEFEYNKGLEKLTAVIKRCNSLQLSPDQTMVTIADSEALQAIMQDDATFNDKTVYIERIPRSWTRDELRDFLNAALKQNLVSYVEMPFFQLQSNSQPKPLNRSWALVEFVSVEAANECKSLFDRFKRRQLVQDEDEQTSNRIHKVLADRDFESIEKMSASELDYLARHVCLWVISKVEWLQLAKEYKEYLKLKKLHQHIQSQLANQPSKAPDYTQGCFLQFTNCQTGTNKGVLIALFERLGGKVAYIELEDNSNNTVGGYLRCETPQCASKIFNSLTSTPIRQLSCGDTLGEPCPDDPDAAIKVNYLSADEEITQWDRVVESRKHARWIKDRQGKRKQDNSAKFEQRKIRRKEEKVQGRQLRRRIAGDEQRQHILFGDDDKSDNKEEDKEVEVE